MSSTSLIPFRRATSPTRASKCSGTPRGSSAGRRCHSRSRPRRRTPRHSARATGGPGHEAVLLTARSLEDHVIDPRVVGDRDHPPDDRRRCHSSSDAARRAAREIDGGVGPPSSRTTRDTLIRRPGIESARSRPHLVDRPDGLGLRGTVNRRVQRQRGDGLRLSFRSITPLHSRRPAPAEVEPLEQMRRRSRPRP